MGAYATYVDVRPHVAGRDILTTSKPTQAEVTTWCTAAENMLKGALGAVGVSVPAVGSDGGLIMTEWISGLYGAGQTRLAWDATTQAGDGQEKVDAFYELLDKIAENGSYYDGMLNGGTSGESSNRVRGYVLDNADDKTIADGDFDPDFTADEEY